MSETGPLVIGYGNALRGDDGVGQEVAQALWAQRSSVPALAGATIKWAHQLAPEMALDISRAAMVVFIDAAADGRPAGSVSVRALGGSEDRAAPERAVGASCWEDIGPESLLALASALYGWSPTALLVTVSIRDPGLGFGLSRAAEGAVRVAASAVVSAVSQPPGRGRARALAGSGCMPDGPLSVGAPDGA
ncbi:MAG TPA: hydrogenase maturation protease [Acidimicrobiales bacterium]|nr:hydrogenase maturation protease [Acidimicrobiales bacterium]